MAAIVYSDLSALINFLGHCSMMKTNRNPIEVYVKVDNNS